MPVVSAVPLDRPAVAGAGRPADPAPVPGAFTEVLSAQLRTTPPPAPTAGRQRVTLSEMVAVMAHGGLGTPSGVPVAAAAGRPELAVIGGPGAPAQAVLAAAERYLGVPYRWGGTDPATGLDCSGFVQRVFADLGVRLPRVSVDQARQGVAVPSLAQAQPGDLVFWGGSPNHIAIYAGEGRILHAPRRGDVVRYEELRRRPPDAIRRVV